MRAACDEHGMLHWEHGAVAAVPAALMEAFCTEHPLWMLCIMLAGFALAFLGLMAHYGKH